MNAQQNKHFFLLEEGNIILKMNQYKKGGQIQGALVQ